MKASLTVILAFIKLTQLVSAAAIANPDVQISLNIDGDHVSVDKNDNEKKVEKSQLNSNRSLLDYMFGFLMDNEADMSIAENKNKKQALPLSDELSVLTMQDDYQVPDKDDLRDINGSSVLYRGGEFGGLVSFAHLPYANCYDPAAFDDEKFDIAVVGAPFDTGTSYRPGTRFGPTGIRMGSRRLAPAYSVYSGFNPYSNWAKIVDCGDPPVTPLDNRIALDQIYRAERAIRNHKTTGKSKQKAPKVFTLGGDHTITLPAVKAAYEKYGKISVIHFDSHLDTWNGIHTTSAMNHGTYLHWAHEKGYLSDNCIHAAIRGPYPGPRDVQHDIDCGFDRILARDIDKIGADGIIKKIKERIGSTDAPVYITVDVDSMDPAFTPATGTVEPGGWSSRELLTVLDGLEGLNVVGGDVVEVSPPYDSAEITSLAAAQVADSIISLMVLKEQE
ncbi:hypothetical protein HII13_002265 [Brettanomyces bruxellensis]|nr:hypothetical protein HII13_002265 [Brettanomyces bruxellensis]